MNWAIKNTQTGRTLEGKVEHVMRPNRTYYDRPHTATMSYEDAEFASRPSLLGGNESEPIQVRDLRVKRSVDRYTLCHRDTRNAITLRNVPADVTDAEAVTAINQVAIVTSRTEVDWLEVKPGALIW